MKMRSTVVVEELLAKEGAAKGRAQRDQTKVVVLPLTTLVCKYTITRKRPVLSGDLSLSCWDLMSSLRCCLSVVISPNTRMSSNLLLCNLAQISVAGHSFDEFHKHSAKLIRTAIFGIDENGKIKNRFAFSQRPRLVLMPPKLKPRCSSRSISSSSRR